MEVEIYQEKGIGVQPEVDQEYKELVEELGLEGQKKLISESPEDSIIPFQKMEPNIKTIWRAYCPGKKSLDDYDAGLIPLQILGVVKLAEEKGYFKKFVVWTEFENDPDPILVGVTDDSKEYLLGRWGESLKPWPEIVKLAKEKWINKVRAKLEKEIRENQLTLDTLEGVAERHFAGEHTGIYI